MAGNIEKIEELLDKSDVEDIRKILRSTLQVLGKIDSVLDANVIATRDLALELHTLRNAAQASDSKDAASRAWVRGAIWAAASLVVIVQTMSGFIVMRHLSDFDKTAAVVDNIDRRLTTVEAQLHMMSGKVK